MFINVFLGKQVSHKNTNNFLMFLNIWELILCSFSMVPIFLLNIGTSLIIENVCHTSFLFILELEYKCSVMPKNVGVKKAELFLLSWIKPFVICKRFLIVGSLSLEINKWKIDQAFAKKGKVRDSKALRTIILIFLLLFSQQFLNWLVTPIR